MRPPRDNGNRGALRRHGRALVRALGVAIMVAAPAGAGAQGFGAAGCGFLGGWAAPMYLDGLRLRELTGVLPIDPHAAIRSGSRGRACAPADDAGTRGPQVAILPVDAIGAGLTEYPRDGINGLRWPGKGFSGAIRGGVAARWGILSAALAPEFAYHQNQDFSTLDVNLPGWSPYAYYWVPDGIDWPQRFGAEPFWWAAPGDSYVRLDARGVSLGFSTETLRWGPARRNPLMMSGAAPGFSHVFFGTSRPVDVWIGRLSTELVWGHLVESDYFDGEADNDRRLFAGFVLTLQPRGLDGLSLGFSRSYIETIPPGGLDFLDYLEKPYSDLLTNKPREGQFGGDNELFAIFGRWVLPESGFELYAEYARDDMWDGLDDLLKEPEHSAAFTAGLQKLVTLGSGTDDRTLRIAGEVTSMNFSETQRSGRYEIIFYTHAGAIQGYTHRGQLLGAPIGPSSDAQSLEVDLLAPRWLAGFYVERIRFANDIYWQTHAQAYTYKGHDVELTGGIRGAFHFVGAAVAVLGDIAWSGRYNRSFIAQTGTLYSEGFERNLTLQIGASWTPASGRSGPGDGPGSRPTRP